MRFRAALAAAPAAVVVLLGTAHAQDTSTQGDEMGPILSMELPEICQMGGTQGMPGMAGMSQEMEGMGEHQRALMESMMATQTPMMQGVMAEDPDVAFACGMIPHHWSAIGMAEVQLQYGDDEQMKELAQKVIDDQTREIEQLITWIEEQAQ